MKNNAFILFLIFCCAGILIARTGAYAPISPSYAISAEVFDLGGAATASSGYNLTGKMREIGPQLTTSSGFTMEGRFMGIVTAGINDNKTPTVTSITPSESRNNTESSFIRNGANISFDAVATLEADHQTDISSTIMTFESSTSLECRFDLSDMPAGKRNVVVTNTGYGRSGSLSNGFTITTGPVEIIGVPHNDPNPFDPNSGVTTIRYTLSTSASINFYLFNQKGEIVWHKTFRSGDNGGVGGDNAVTWNGRSDFAEGVPTGVYLLSIIASKDTRELGRIKVAVIRH